MENFTEILKLHTLIYPKMQPCDVVKLIFQSVFGGGHLVNGGDAESRIRNEYNSVSHEGKRRTESLGETSRIYIDCPLTERELSLISAIFTASSEKFPVGYSNADEAVRNRFIERLEVAKKLSYENIFNFDTEDFTDYIREYFSLGCPAVSHSKDYRSAYSPAYRVIDTRYVRLLECIIEIDNLIYNKIDDSAPVVVAIDGRAASGKTTAADLISEVINQIYSETVQVVHMDDFFLPFELRTASRLAEPGGNLHRERFSEEVLAHLRDKNGFYYREFDCSSGDYKPNRRHIKPSRLIICEGAYSLHPSFGNYYDLAVFSTLEPEEQERRILARNGQKALGNFKSKWIPMEEQYFKTFDIQKKCKYII
jgi:uridine kinase